MIFLIRLIQNAVSIYSIILVAFALLSWFPNAYESQLGRLVIRLAGLDFTVWVALILIQFLGNILTRLVLLI